jgi:hypothetical protein
MNDHVPPVESICAHAAEQVMHLNREIERRDKLMRELLKHIGVRAVCRFCKAHIVFVKHIETTGRTAPYDYDGQNHHGACPSFQRSKKEQYAAATTND